jgi:lysophospholipase L1-like esterase
MNSHPLVWFFVFLFILAPRSLSQSLPENAGSERWEQEIGRLTCADRTNPPAPGAVVFVGSSSIRLWHTLAQDFPGIHTLNRGFGGSHLSDVLFYADRIIIPYRPRIIVVYAGDNDLAAGKTPQDVVADYQSLVAHIHKQLPAARIGFISIKPSIARWHFVAHMRTANRLIAAWSRQDERLFFADVFSLMLGADGTPQRELFVADGLHLSTAGYVVWQKTVAPYLTTK